MNKGRLLVVEDEPISLELLVGKLIAEGYEVDSATIGEDAWRLFSSAPERYHAVLLDRILPDMDAIEVLHRIKADSNLHNVPVIMQTAMTSTADITTSLRAGAYYYVTKPFSVDTLLAVVGAAVADRRRFLTLQQSVRQTERALYFLNKAEFTFRLPQEASIIAALVAHAAPNPAQVVVGLTELMLNAIEHGNLAISYQEKSELLKKAQLSEEIRRRLNLPAYAKKQAFLHLQRTSTEVCFIILDQGNGFNWNNYLEISPERAFDTHGRGIAMSKRLSFDRLEYRGCGNEVLAAVTISNPNHSLP
ncbi:Response regulator receiver protein [Gammaproteobacteria bacterium]